MDYQQVLAQARPVIGKICKACPVCNGRACGNQMPGPGAKGVGDTAIRNYEKWQEIRVNMDTLVAAGPVSMERELFGKTFKYPFFAAPVGAVKTHYGDKYSDAEYNDILLPACADAGILAFAGDGVDAKVMEGAAAAIKKVGGLGIPTIKPWNMELVHQKLELIKESGAVAVAMDVDGAGLPFLKHMQPPAGPRSPEELQEIVAAAGRFFIVKGIMTVRGALKAPQAGAAAIVVSNHGGRVLDQCPATAEVLPEIVAAVKGQVKILVDGGIRSGVDVFKALAMGADAVLIARPFVTAVYGAGADGVQVYINKIAGELEDTMLMCGARNLAEITPDMVRLPR